METERIAQGLIDRSLPKAQWTHHAHLRAGLWHVLHYPEAQALDLLRERIRAYNLATGVANSQDAGYHETITRFYVRLLCDFVAQAERTRPLDELAHEAIERLGAKDLPLRYYSAARLFGRPARAGWVEPDLQPLPGAPSA
jgi:hypothetical protein